ncbi:MAG: catalase [Oscillospiraceae bacterium]|nr:catalase [Oscillospiraceae bacterium]
MKINIPFTGLAVDPENIKKHFDTVNKHRLYVCMHCFKAGIYWQGLTHDLSKYSPEEFLVSASMYQGTRSPNEGEREDKGYSLAWMHHKGRNKHHFEYWTDYDPATRKMSPVKMPLIYVIEMFCDRVAASKVYMGDAYNDGCPLAYFDKGRHTRMIHPTTSKLLEKLLIMLRDRGEEYTFAYIRQLMRKSRS